MVWSKPKILEELRRLQKAGKDLSYNGLARRNQALLSAAAYHFGSYRVSVEKAGIDYATVSRRPRWTKSSIIALIKAARRAGNDLHWSSVTRRRDELGKAAFAALQPRLFGRWDRALHAAGLDADDISRYRRWDRNTIISEMRELARDGRTLNSGQMQATDPGLHAAAVRHFGAYDRALIASKLDPAAIRVRRSWTHQQIVAALKDAVRNRRPLQDRLIRRQMPALYGAAVRRFGTFAAACKAARLSRAKRL